MMHVARRDGGVWGDSDLLHQLTIKTFLTEYLWTPFYLSFIGKGRTLLGLLSGWEKLQVK